MKFRFIVEADVERTEGKFASRDELAEQLREAIEDADPGEVVGENDGQYVVEAWTVEDAP